MSENFFDLSPQEQKNIIEGAEGTLGIVAVAIEKDVWICWLLASLFDLDIPMVFKGGTSLSKIYDLIDRFSEDIDITIDRNYLDNEISDLNQLSATKLKKLRANLESKLSSVIEDKIIPHLEAEVETSFPKICANIRVEKEGNDKIIFQYPNVVENRHPYIRERIILEFGGVNEVKPNEVVRVQALLSEQVTADLILPDAKVCALSPMRTFWEKATFVHELCHGDKLHANQHRLSRHWYDLVQIYKSNIGQDCLKNTQLLIDVVQIKTAFYRRGYSNFDKCLKNDFILTPNDMSLKGLREDYNAMINAGMFPNKPLDFDELIYVIEELNQQLNS